jgi:16S rRNA C967 or C1407 C5-methylase (RsmB/RsmF family)
MDADFNGSASLSVLLQLLLAGLRALKPGGSLAYSTCSLAEEENDHVVEKALKLQQQMAASRSSSGLARVVPVNEWCWDGELQRLLGAERTKYGVICLPDKQGWGVIYVCLLKKC